MRATQYPGIYANQKSFVIDLNIFGIRVRESIPVPPTAERLRFANEKRWRLSVMQKWGYWTMQSTFQKVST